MVLVVVNGTGERSIPLLTPFVSGLRIGGATLVLQPQQ